jgi:deoxyadenosine/deoxycytidine kinase
MNNEPVVKSSIDKPRLVSLCGCLCAGKSTLADSLVSMRIANIPLKEDLKQHPIYQAFLNTTASWMVTQLEFYVRWAQLICSIEAQPGQVVVVDHSLDVHHNVYSSLAHDLKHISDREWYSLCAAYDAFGALTNSRFVARNLILNVSSQTLVSRLQTRNRDLGDEIHLELVTRQAAKFESWALDQEQGLILSEGELVSELMANTTLHDRIRLFIDNGLQGTN